MIQTATVTKQQDAGACFHVQAVFGTSFTFLTSGVFLSGLAMYMGAGDLLVSYISMITNICGVSILFFSSVTGRFRSLKKAAAWLTAASRAATLLIVLIPPFVPKDAQIAVFIPLMIVAFTLQAQTTVVLNNWMVCFVDGQEGAYVARRQTIVLSVTVILSLAGGRMVDRVSGAYIGFALLFFAAFLMAAGELYLLSRIPDAMLQKPAERNGRFSDMISIPAKNRPYLAFILYVFLFYLFLTVADSFTVVYMMRYLALSYTATTVMQMLISLPQVFLLGIWGRISDRKGHRFVLTASIWFFVGEMFFMALAGPQNKYIAIPAAFLISSIGNSGFVVSVFNRRYELMPKENRILYDNFYSAAVGLAFILGPVTGGAVKGLLENLPSVDSFLQFGSIRLLYAASAAAIILLQFTVRRVLHKKNEANL